MARAGYDPNDMANMFKTIQKQGGSGGPQWLSDHPDPGNRSAYIAREARSLRVENPIRDTREFAAGAGAPEAAAAGADDRAGDRRPRAAPATAASSGAGLPSGRVEPPSPSFQTYTEGNVFRISVPSNWRELPGHQRRDVRAGGRVRRRQRPERVHARRRGRARRATRSHDLQTATDELLASLGAGQSRA